jgi:hypothetical protein
VSKETISRITGKVIAEMQDWQVRAPGIGAGLIAREALTVTPSPDKVNRR